MKKKKGFTLVELLAVIVILAVILVIAVPKIMDTIQNSKEGTLMSSAKLIASQAEKKYVENQVLGINDVISCDDVVKTTDADYDYCNISFDSDGKASVTISGKGKFEGLAVCNATKIEASISDNCYTDEACFAYEQSEFPSSYDINESGCRTYVADWGMTSEGVTSFCTGGQGVYLANLKNDINDGYQNVTKLIEAGVISNVVYDDSGEIVQSLTINEIACKTYVSSWGLTTEQETTYCTGGTTIVYDWSLSDYINDAIEYDDSDYINELIDEGVINNISYDASITGYDIDCGTDVWIPDKIDGDTVVAISKEAFTQQGENPNIKAMANINNYNVMPIISIPFALGITSVKFPNTIKYIGVNAFRESIISGELNLSNLTDLTEIGDGAFAYNQIASVILPSSVESIGDYAFAMESGYLNNVYLGNLDATIGSYSFGCPAPATHNLPDSYEFCPK